MLLLAADKAGAESTTITKERPPLQQLTYSSYCCRILLHAVGYETQKLLTGAEFVIE